VANAAGHLGAYDTLMKRSENFHNVYNPKTGFMAPRYYDGSWDEKTDEGFTEGKPYTYLFSAAQDIPGLIELLGGRKVFIQKLDKMFNGGHYVHENEPGHNYTYLYDYAGESWKTQMRVAHYRIAKYRDGPQGMNGDDDCGQMSAWYIFSSFGFYPVTPGTDIYALGTPLFHKSTIYFDPTDRTKKFEVTAENVSARNIYVQSVYLNGVLLDKPFIHHSDIINGGTLLFKMGSKPRKDW
jgi:predicted alpha-1,2-mannosidase